MAKQQFIFGVRSNVMRRWLNVNRLKNLKPAIEYWRLLDVANRTVHDATSPNVNNMFSAFSIFNATQMTN